MSAQAHSAQVLQSLLVDAQLSPPIRDSAFSSLSLLVGPQMLLDALDLIDRDKVVRRRLPNGRCIYQVASSTSGTYTVQPSLGVEGSVGGYCPCAAFSHGVVASGDSTLCKHLLAAALTMGLSTASPRASSQSAFVDELAGLTWIAGHSTGFGAVEAM
ncbi:hypothetical protein JCM10207_007327 [Rhodosporidiobolus poonsookiae]